jgi:hypothetical protein
MSSAQAVSFQPTIPRLVCCNDFKDATEAAATPRVRKAQMPAILAMPAKNIYASMPHALGRRVLPGLPHAAQTTSVISSARARQRLARAASASSVILRTYANKQLAPDGCGRPNA